jgi:pyrimidine-nucleoside phosphorylase
MTFLSLLESKRDGRVLDTEQIRKLIADFTAGKIPDYQMAALLMAIYFRGLNPQETRDWTLAMRDSGQTLRFPEDPRPLVDKHSTGGVGDKVSLPLAPLLATLGFRVPMISGRALGITGGTLDKLESIPGFTTTLPTKRIIEQVQQIGCVICGQTDQMVPADKLLYALRDVTGTVPSIPLITASILSKKLAEGIQALLLDVKYGRAAFMPSREQASDLAQAMVTLGNQSALRTQALLTPMDVPLGRAAGNWLEVKEAVECLQGRGPDDLRNLVIECAAQLQLITAKAPTLPNAREQAAKSLDSGAAHDRWRQMLQAQGADWHAFQKKLNRPEQPLELRSERAGLLADCNARIIGEVIRDLGSGRIQKDDVLNLEAGLDQIAKPGDVLQKGDVLCRVHGVKDLSAPIRSRLLEAFSF